MSDLENSPDSNLIAQRAGHQKADILIVGLGASAGGIQALREFFEHVPADSGMAYVVILHLSPDHDSQLAEVLQQVCKLPVMQVIERVLVAPDQVYVVPPDQHLEMDDGYIIVSPNTLIEERRAPVDIFFRTLAESHHSRAVGVILSGTGANGSMGIKRIKERGGAAFVQNPREAEFNEMPRNSIATGFVDSVLPVAEIPAKVIAYKDSLGTIEIPIEPEAQPKDQQYALREIFTLLRSHTGHDFSSYKRPTLLRRIERRVNVHDLPSLPAYATFMQQNPAEAHALLKDLLISVTNFFRDKKAFEQVEQDILPRLLHEKKAREPLRIWVIGCATGEEAYSLAMLCAERTMGVIEAPKIQIFATDIDEHAIAVAREGLYTINDAADVSPERLRLFFNREGEQYRVRREIREIVLFTVHNAIKDPPFSRVDLVSCRNLMIYLNQAAQERILETIHFTLNAGGYLFLGTSESTDGAGDLFATFSREHHLYQSREVVARPYPVPESVPAFRHAPPHRADAQQDGSTPLRERPTYGDLHAQLLEQYAPPSIVVNEDYDIVHLSERAGRYLQIAGGEPSNNLLKLVRPELSLELRGALYQATSRKANVEVRGLPMRIDEKIEAVNIHVRPVLRDGDTARGFILVLFEPAEPETVSDEEIVTVEDKTVARQLEEELGRLKAQLRAANEQHEYQAEELKASNEELQAMNEELRSAAEELETSTEELQSINEELTTVNQELKIKVEETSIASNNLQNLIDSTEIATIFLDRSFRVVLFTPDTREIFNLLPTDYGRPLSDITHRLEYSDLIADAEAVLDKLQPVEREVSIQDASIQDASTFIMRVFPYRTADDRIQGVVITFADITERKRAADIVRASEERLQRMVNVPRVGVLTFDYTGAMHHANGAFLEMVGYNRVEFDAQKWTWRDFTPAEYVEAGEGILEQLRQRGRGGPYEKEYFRKDGSRAWMMFVAADLGDGTFVEYAFDISDRKRIEAALRASEERHRLLVESVTDYAIFTLDQKGIIIGWNPGAEKIFGWSEDEAIGQSDDMIFTPEDHEKGEADKEMREAIQNGRAMDERWHLRKDGSRFYASGVLVRLGGEEKLLGFVKIARDLTERKKMEDELQKAHDNSEKRVAERTAELASAVSGLEREMTERKNLEAARLQLLGRLVSTQEEERTRISRELHDEMGQHLTALMLGLKSLPDATAPDLLSAPSYNQRVKQLQDLTGQVMDRMHSLARALRPAALDTLGLEAALRGLVEQWSHSSEITAQFQGRGLKSGVRLASHLETTIYRIVQEALTNVQRHAKAQNVAVLLERSDKEVIAVIEDDGQGFDIKTKGKSALVASKGRLGLMGMTERAEMVGGVLTIESSPGKGTTVQVRLPVEQRKKREPE